MHAEFIITWKILDRTFFFFFLTICVAVIIHDDLILHTIVHTNVGVILVGNGCMSKCRKLVKFNL